MRVLGLDVGERTIGVAVSDSLGWTAQGVTTVRRKTLEDDLSALNGFIKEFEVSLLVVGLPKNMDGSLGPAAERILKLVKVLKDSTGLPVETWDERLSTVAAEKMLIGGDVSRAKRKKVIDKMAAVLILQGYLDFTQRNKS